MRVENKTAKIKHETYSSGSSATTLRPNTLATRLTICEEWKLSIDLKLPNQSTTEWRQIFSLQVNGTNDPTAGSRISEVWIQSGPSSIMLMIAYDTDSNPNNTYNITTKLEVGNWINLKISQISEVYEIWVDYKLTYNKTISTPKPWTNVKLVTDSNYGTKNVSAVVHYRNFELNTCPKKGNIILRIKPKPNNLECLTK